jgi:NitT/TauT family transport system substrate-binding protein
MTIGRTRRQILGALSSAAAASLFPTARALAEEGNLETTSIRLVRSRAICVVPEYVAEELLRAEGFTDVRYVEIPAPGPPSVAALGRGEVDFAVNYASVFVQAIDGGAPVKLLTGVHVGCFELFAHERIRGIGDLKGKSIGVQGLGSTDNVLLSVILHMATMVGLDPVRDISWVTDPKVKPKDLFVAGKIDAFLGFPPEPQELRARHIGHVLLNTATDHPWSQYFCCMLGGNSEFIRRHPVATKRVVRAIVKAADLCASEPPRVAKLLVEGRFTPRYDYALQMLQELPYNKWREYDAEDTLRFYALRMRETGFIKSLPQKIIGENTDWRFLNELKHELKA